MLDTFSMHATSPGAMALASIPNVETGGTLKSSLDVAEAVYAAQGAELNHLGVNWVFAPVGDVNSERENPVIGLRSFGDGMSPFNILLHYLNLC